MKKIKMTIELVSDTLSGAGEGFGATIDTDIQYDKSGIPFISSKRIKGALKNSLVDLLKIQSVKNKLNIQNEKSIVNKCFGHTGAAFSSPFQFSDFFVEEYDSIKNWVEYLSNNYESIISSEKVLSSLTNIRQQTTIDDNGVAAKHSLRTSRVVNKGLKFNSYILFDDTNQDYVKYLALACSYLRKIGLKRNRGLGEIKCSLFNENDEDLIENAISELEKI